MGRTVPSRLGERGLARSYRTQWKGFWCQGRSLEDALSQWQSRYRMPALARVNSADLKSILARVTYVYQ